MLIQKIEFKNSLGRNLAAKLELPVNRRPHNFAIFAHCFTCNKNFNAVRFISAALAAKGFGVLSSEQRKRLLEIANKCPVHRTLENTARIKTKLKQ